MASPSTPFESYKPSASLRDRLSSEIAYIGMICFTVFLYIIMALLSLAPNGTVGKISPIQEAVQNNDYLSRLLDLVGVSRASSTQLQFALYFLLFFILVSYAWAVLIFRRRQDKGLMTILGIAVLLCILMTFIPPLLSKDVFSNIFYGKIAARYHDNPYVITPQRFSGDQLMAYVSLNWKNTAIVYGPLHTYFSMFLNLGAGQGVTANIFVFKGAMAIFHILNVILVWLTLGVLAPRRQRFGTMIYAWNPLALVIGVGGGHNDLMMMTLVLFSLYLLLKGRHWTGYVVLCLSVAVKYISVILVVALIIYFLSRKKGWMERLRYLALYLTVLALIFMLLFLPFWDGFRTFSSTMRNLQLNNFSSIGGLLSELFAALMRFILRVPADLAKTLGGILSRILLLPFFFATLWLAPRRVRDSRDLANCFFAVTLAYLLTAGYYMPWYMIWLLPLISLRPWDRLSRYSLGLGTATIYIGSDVHPY